MVKVKEDLTGKRFERLKVIRQADDYVRPNGRRSAQWLVKCDCGSEPFVVLGASLKSNKTKSCGCLNREKQLEFVQNSKKYNAYDLSGEYGIGWTTNTNEEFWFDLEDYGKIKDYCWRSQGNYIITIDSNGKAILLHRLVMDMVDADWDKIRIDHKVHGKPNELKFDNRKENLRIATPSKNGMNQCLRSDNKSGVTGVFKNKHNQWIAVITVNKKTIHLGCFDEDEFDDAVRARKEAEEKYFGKWSYDNSQKQ